MEIRIARLADTPQILAIYEPFIRNEVTTFETEVPSLQDFQQRIKEHLIQFPWLVACENGKISGYAYAAPHRSRCSYQWSCETSIYLAPESRGKGIAAPLYEKLFSILKDQGVVNLFAGAALPNEASVKFHQKMGFSEVGTYKKIGYKLGRWIDTYWMQKILNENVENPTRPIPFSEIKNNYE